MLDNETFRTIVSSTPLIAIDLILYDDDYNIIVGIRNNEPAKGSYFVPGGRIRKSETLNQAFSRISENEIGISLSIENSKMVGVYEHYYNNSIFGDEISTHYVVIAHLIKIDNSLEIKSDDQHDDLIRISCEHINDVHEYSKPYFDIVNNQKMFGQHQ